MVQLDGCNIQVNLEIFHSSSKFKTLKALIEPFERLFSLN